METQTVGEELRNNMKVHIVIPIGVGAPGTPVQEYLEASVNSILNQTSNDYILTVAADENIPDRCKEFLEKNGIEVVWYQTWTYFRKGGIWKKIFDTWKTKDTEYVAFLHYDDLWDSQKLAIQLETLKEPSIKGCWSEAYMMDGAGNVNPTDYSFVELTRDTVGSRTMAFSHSIIVSREAIFNSGILDHEEKWAANFEDMYSLFFHKVKAVVKSPGAKFFWRNHDMNISNTVREEAEFVIQQRRATAYTLNETLKDGDEIKTVSLIESIKRLY